MLELSDPRHDHGARVPRVVEALLHHGNLDRVGRVDESILGALIEVVRLRELPDMRIAVDGAVCIGLDVVAKIGDVRGLVASIDQAIVKEDLLVELVGFRFVELLHDGRLGRLRRRRFRAPDLRQERRL